MNDLARALARQLDLVKSMPSITLQRTGSVLDLDDAEPDRLCMTPVTRRMSNDG